MVTKCLGSVCSGDFFSIINTPYISGETLAKELSLFPESNLLIKEAQKKITNAGFGRLEVLVNKTITGFNAETLKNRITIMPDLPASTQRRLFLFELTNVIAHQEMEKTWQKMLQGIYKSPEEYARAKERVEFNGIIRYNNLAKTINGKCVCNIPYLENYWEPFPIGIIGLEAVGFENYYSYILDDDHIQFYRTQWKEIHGDDRSNENRNALQYLLLISTAALVTYSIVKIFNLIPPIILFT
ncbi:MAG TPA: hypothetical protein VGP47_09920 [Parachlamydiaceae bacterium]|nr:hypothetical protein [Parachlamydiaceae bacterium]